MTSTTPASTSRHAGNCTCREHPYLSSMRVRDARDVYLAENGFSVAGYDEPTTPASFLGVSFTVPNTPRHRWAIMLHDLHHIATGYGTDLMGEGEISLWEARRNLRPLGLYVGSIVTSGALLGMVIGPRRAWRALHAPGALESLFGSKMAYDRLLEMTVGELRALLGLPEEGLALEPRRLHSKAPTDAAVVHAAQ